MKLGIQDVFGESGEPIELYDKHGISAKAIARRSASRFSKAKALRDESMADRKHGGPEVLTRSELPDPAPGPMEARVRVEAVGLNHLDLWVRKGVPGHKFPLPITPGCDIAGDIDQFGPGAEAALASSSD